MTDNIYIGQFVIHDTYGKGEIVSCDEKYIDVRFSRETKTFQFPAAFQSFLTLTDEMLSAKTKELLAERARYESSAEKIKQKKPVVEKKNQVDEVFAKVEDFKVHHETFEVGKASLDTIYAYDYYPKRVSHDQLPEGADCNRKLVWALKDGSPISIAAFADIINKALEEVFADLEGKVYLMVVPSSDVNSTNALAKSVEIVCNRDTNQKYVDSSKSLYRNKTLPRAHCCGNDRPSFEEEFDSIRCRALGKISESDKVVILDDIMTKGDQMLSCALRIKKRGVKLNQILLFPMERTVKGV